MSVKGELDLKEQQTCFLHLDDESQLDGGGTEAEDRRTLEDPQRKGWNAINIRSYPNHKPSRKISLRC